MKRAIRKTFKKRVRASSDLERSVREFHEALIIHKQQFNYKKIDKMLSDIFDILDKGSKSYESLKNQTLNIQKGIEDQLYTEDDVDNVCSVFGMGPEDIDPVYYKNKHFDMEDLANQVSLIDVIDIDD